MADRLAIKIKRHPRINPRAFRFGPAEMRRLALIQNRAMLIRVAGQRNVFDQQMPPLTPKYQRRKQSLSKRGVRDLRLTGNMLGAIHTAIAEAGRFVLAIRGATPTIKYRVNQLLSPWWGFAVTDARQLDRERDRISREKLKDFFVTVRR